MTLAAFAFSRAAEAFVTEFQKKPASLEYLDILFPHLQLTLDWLLSQSEPPLQEKLCELMLTIAPYLEARSYHSVALKYLPTCLIASKDQPQTQIKLLLLAFQANFMAGEWEKAKEMAEVAIGLKSNCDLTDEALIYNALATLQLNRGDFQPALENFNHAKEIFRELGDEDRIFEVTSQEAAYYLNKENYLKAEELYTKVEAHEITSTGAPSSQTLLMMGVISRRLKRVEKAIDYLHRLAEQGLVNNSKSDLATGLHHLAWIYIDQNKLSQAWDYGETAHNLYTEISDPRGVSDADEQLGEIASLQGNYTASRYYLMSVIKVRRRLENKVGLASASRRLSKVFFKEKKWLRGIFYLTYSACMYAHLGMLTSTRIKRWLHT